MRNPQKIMEECVAEIKAINIPVREEDILKIILSKNVDFGSIHDDGYWKNWIILIRKDLLNEDYPMVILKQTFIQQLLHTCPRCYNHGKIYIKYIKMMNEAYGYNMMVINDNDSVFHPEKPIVKRFVCPNCGAIYNQRTPSTHKRLCIYCNIELEEVKEEKQED